VIAVPLAVLFLPLALLRIELTLLPQRRGRRGAGTTRSDYTLA